MKRLAYGAAIAALLLAGCDSGTTPDAKKAAEKAAEKTTEAVDKTAEAAGKAVDKAKDAAGAVADKAAAFADKAAEKVAEVADKAVAAVAGGTKAVWEISGLAGPESALVVPAAGLMYVSNVDGEALGKDGKGWIAKVSLDGKTVNKDFATGLNAPMGMAIVGDKMYVADIDEFVEINLADGKIVAKHAAEGAKRLNDAAADSKGNVYATDTLTNSVYRLSGGKVDVFVKDDQLAGPNGILVEGDNLIVNTWGVLSGDGWKTKTPGGMFTVSLADKSIKAMGDGKPFGNLDGMIALGDGAYVLTDWMAGKVLKYSKDGKVETLLELGQGAADMGYDPATKTMYVPQMMKGTLHALTVQ
jgi:DNA-binding beta-propeller fold protein YncE